jgi:hypothetical protein
LDSAGSGPIRHFGGVLGFGDVAASHTLGFVREEQLGLFPEGERKPLAPSPAASRTQFGGVFARLPLSDSMGTAPMFATAREIQANFKPWEADREARWEPASRIVNPNGGSYRSETDRELWNRKADEADQNGLTDRIAAAGGVNRPVPIYTHRREGNFQLIGGHHRVASEAVNNPDRPIALTYIDHPNAYEALQQAHYSDSTPNYDETHLTGKGRHMGEVNTQSENDASDGWDRLAGKHSGSSGRHAGRWNTFAENSTSLGWITKPGRHAEGVKQPPRPVVDRPNRTGATW